MKIHKYKITVYESVLDFEHKMGGQTETRLYFKGKGVLGYRDKNKIDFFSNDSETIQEAENAIHNKDKNAKYFGVVKGLPEELVESVILAGIKMKEVQEEFQNKGKSLVSLIKI